MPGRSTTPERSDINAHVGRSIAVARGDADLTQTQLGAKAGVSQGAISRIESGESTAQPDQLFAIAEACNVAVQSFFPKQTWLSETGETKKRSSTESAPALRLVADVSGVPTTLDAGRKRPPGLEGWLARRQIITERELWNLERWVAQDALNPTDPAYWDEALDFVRKRIADRGGKGR